MKIKAIADLTTDSRIDITIPDDDRCPICKTALVITPIEGIAFYNAGSGSSNLSVFCYCPSCKNTYINTYKYSLGIATQKIKSEPNHFKKVPFNEKIEKLSPSFVEIFNQAKQAESSQLNQIAGIGYRKALEFLIKDFTISQNPDKEEHIKSAQLGHVIRDYITDNKIKDLAEKTSWIGNDETHYVRKHTDRDIEDLKRFISACVYFINMYLIYKDSQSVERK